MFLTIIWEASRRRSSTNTKECEMRKRTADEDIMRRTREEAWVGDAVLGLFAREWILRTTGKMDAEMFARLTSNHFLASMGNPTEMEAAIGRHYTKHGLASAFEKMEKELLPLFRKQELNRVRKQRK